MKCLSRHDATADMQHGLVLHQVWSSDLTSGQMFKLTCWGQNTYVWMRLDATNTMVLSIFHTFFFSLNVICKTDILKATFLFDLPWTGQDVTQGSQIGDGWIQNIPNFPLGLVPVRRPDLFLGLGYLLATFLHWRYFALTSLLHQSITALFFCFFITKIY